MSLLLWKPVKGCLSCPTQLLLNQKGTRPVNATQRSCNIHATFQVSRKTERRAYLVSLSSISKIRKIRILGKRDVKINTRTPKLQENGFEEL